MNAHITSIIERFNRRAVSRQERPQQGNANGAMRSRHSPAQTPSKCKLRPQNSTDTKKTRQRRRGHTNSERRLTLIPSVCAAVELKRDQKGFS
jgi:hypothetical protein